MSWRTDTGGCCLLYTSIIDGKCVRLSQGDYDSKKVYNENPVEVAKEFEANGVRSLHGVDLDGAASHQDVYKRQVVSCVDWVIQRHRFIL